MSADDIDLTETLARVASGQHDAADRLLPLVYDQLRRLAGSMLNQESPGNTLQPTALVHETYLRMADQTRVDWRGKSHFFAIGAKMMRRILVDHARGKKRNKRGGDMPRIPLTDDLEDKPSNKRWGYLALGAAVVAALLVGGFFLLQPLFATAFLIDDFLGLFD